MNEKKESLESKSTDAEQTRKKPTAPPNSPTNPIKAQKKTTGPLLITPEQMSAYKKKTEPTFFKASSADLYDWDSAKTDELSPTKANGKASRSNSF